MLTHAIRYQRRRTRRKPHRGGREGQLILFKFAPGVFYTYFYNHAHRLRLEKLLYVELSRSSNGFFKPLLDSGGILLLKPPHGGLRSETVVTQPLQKRNGYKFITVKVTAIP